MLRNRAKRKYGTVAQKIQFSGFTGQQSQVSDLELAIKFIA